MGVVALQTSTQFLQERLNRFGRKAVIRLSLWFGWVDT